MKNTNFAILFLLMVPTQFAVASEGLSKSKSPEGSSILIDLDFAAKDYEHADGATDGRKQTPTVYDQLVAKCHDFMARLHELKSVQDVGAKHAAFESLCLKVKDFATVNIERLTEKKSPNFGQHKYLQHLYNEHLIKKMQEFADECNYSSLPMFCKVVDSFEDLCLASSDESDDVRDPEIEEEVVKASARLRRKRSAVNASSAPDLTVEKPPYHLLAATCLPKDRPLD